MDASVAVIVLNWNGGDDTLRCLECVAAQDHPGPVSVFLVDNGSTDGSTDRVAGRFRDVEIVRNDQNLGYCEGNNRGLARAIDAGAAYSLLLNSDAFLEPGAVRELVAALEGDGSAGIAGPRIVDAEDPTRVWSAGGELRVRENVGRLIGKGRPDGARFDRGGEVDFVTGCVLLVRNDLLRRIGLLDPDYFAYLEDVDLCLRARDAGARILYVPEARATHRESSSSGGGYTRLRKYLMGRNSVLFLRRHGSARHWAGFLLFSVLALPLALLVQSARGNGPSVMAKARGILHGFLGRRGRMA